MTKQEFTNSLRTRLSGLPKGELEERLSFYSEMIDDLTEDGLTEEEAVAKIGSVEDIARQIIADIPLTKIAKHRIKRSRAMGAWEIVLLILGSPIWLSLLIALFTVIISIYAVLWSLIISLWAVFASVIGCALGALICGAVYVCTGNTLSGLGLIGAALVCAGLSIFLFFGCKASAKGTLLLTKKIAIGIKNCFIKKEVA